MTAYYNEFKPEAAAMLRQLIKDGLIADGDVDERSITEVKADELRGYTQCHFFAGIGGWSVALRLAGWPDDRPVWTGSCPCQPFSTAGKGKGKEDERDLWPVWFSLIRECRPERVFGEQVASAISHGWLDRMRSGMEGENYAIGAAVLPACAVDAPHKRDRLWFVADAEGERSVRKSENERGEIERPEGYDGDQLGQPSEVGGGDVGDAEHDGRNGRQNTGSNETPVFGREEGKNRTREPTGTSDTGAISDGTLADAECKRLQGQGKMGESLCPAQGEDGKADKSVNDSAGFWSDHDWLVCGDGKIRRVPSAKSSICIVAHGIQHRAPLLHAFGNAIVPEVAARFIKATM